MAPSYDSDPFRYLRGRPDPRNQFINNIDYIAQLFLNGEPGLWLDLSDLSTLFQDTAGTVPVTAPGQTVALARDKSGRGNHLVQPVALSRPTLGRHPVGGRRNLLTQTEDFSNSVWQKTGMTATADSCTSTDIVAHILQNAPSLKSGQPYCFSVKLKASTAPWVALRVTAYDEQPAAWFNLGNGTIGTVNTQITASISAIDDDGFYRCSIVFSSTTDVDGGVNAYITNANGNFNTTVGATVYIKSAQLEAGSAPTAYQRVTSDWDVTEVGKADCWYLGFDGVDDFMVSAATLDMSGTDRLTMWAGLEKFSNLTGIVCEQTVDGNAVPGGWYLAAANSTADASFTIRGATRSVVVNAPTNTVGTKLYSARGSTGNDIDQIIRRGGVQVGTMTITKGGGNLANDLLYVGSRGGKTIPMRMNLYQLVTRGAFTDDDTMLKVDIQNATKMGVTL